jgi:hypothetical protein
MVMRNEASPTYAVLRLWADEDEERNRLVAEFCKAPNDSSRYNKEQQVLHACIKGNMFIQNLSPPGAPDWFNNAPHSSDVIATLFIWAFKNDERFNALRIH